MIEQEKAMKCIFWFHQGDSEIDFHCSYLHKCPQVLHPIRTKSKQPHMPCLASRYLQSVSRLCVHTHTHRGASHIVGLVIKYCFYTINLTNRHWRLDGFVDDATTSQILLAKKS